MWMAIPSRIPSSSYRILNVIKIFNKTSLLSVALENVALIEYIRTKKVIPRRKRSPFTFINPLTYDLRSRILGRKRSSTTY